MLAYALTGYEQCCGQLSAATTVSVDAQLSQLLTSWLPIAWRAGLLGLTHDAAHEMARITARLGSTNTGSIVWGVEDAGNGEDEEEVEADAQDTGNEEVGSLPWANPYLYSPRHNSLTTRPYSQRIHPDVHQSHPDEAAAESASKQDSDSSDKDEEPFDRSPFYNPYPSTPSPFT